MSTETVTVACKMPHGLVLRLHKQENSQEPMPGGGVKPVKVWRPDTTVAPITVKGYLDKYDPKNPPVSAGSKFALTEGVPKDFWDKWLEQNKDLDAVQNGLIFASDKRDTVNGLMADLKGQRSGFEPVDPSKLPKGIETFKKDAA